MSLDSPQSSTPKQNKSTPGSGHLHVSHPSRSQFSTLLAQYPLKLLAPDALPSQPSHIAIAYTLAYGGGLVAGDVISLRVEVDEGCGLILLTQGSTKLFKHRPGIRPLSHHILNPGDNLTRQRLHVNLRPKSFLFLLPDSVSPFRGSRYSQTQRFILPSCRTASVIILDWVNSGRGQHRSDGGDEEIWAMEYYGSTNEVFIGDKVVMRERMVLDNGNSSLGSAISGTKRTITEDGRGDKAVLLGRVVSNQRTSNLGPTQSGNQGSKIAKNLSPYHVYATILILGPHTAALRAHLQQISLATSQMQVNRPSEILWAYSQTDEQGGVLRMAGKEVEDVKGWLKGVMDEGGIRDMVGDGLWPRVI